jgi:hypothetical protein
MLAYVFWHWRKDERSAKSYELALKTFHNVLARAKPDGFASSTTFKIARLPWKHGSKAYEDWYLVKNFASLGTLNEGAISPTCLSAHNAVARLSAGGTGGVYRLHGTEASLDNFCWATWFSKPDGTKYKDFFNELSRTKSDSTSRLFQRQLVLGPAPEFCILGTVPVKLTGLARPVTVRTRSLS